MGTSNQDTISSLLGAWRQGNAAAAAEVRKHFTDDCVWEQTAMPTTTGPDEAVALIESMNGMGLKAVNIDILAIEGDGDTVFTERIDDIVADDGSIALSLKVAGVTNFRDGKICAWREYFDSAALGGLPAQ
jgi:limonene-1,2-epoxide hydrolase